VVWCGVDEEWVTPVTLQARVLFVPRGEGAGSIHPVCDYRPKLLSMGTKSTAKAEEVIVDSGVEKRTTGFGTGTDMLKVGTTREERD
jgi:hypothetical protein